MELDHLKEGMEGQKEESQWDRLAGAGDRNVRWPGFEAGVSRSLSSLQLPACGPFPCSLILASQTRSAALRVSLVKRSGDNLDARLWPIKNMTSSFKMGFLDKQLI